MMEAELDDQLCEHVPVYGSGVVQLEQQVKTLRSELAIKSSQIKRAEQQRNLALSNAERLSITLKNYKDEVGEKLTKVIKSETRLKQTLIVCDQERAELEKRCAELESEKGETHQTIRHLKERCERAEAQRTESGSLQLQDAELKIHKMKMELIRQQDELQGVKKEQQELNRVISCQEKHLAEQQREIQQKVLELRSLEEIFHLLHLRKGTEEGLSLTSPACLTSPPCPSTNDQVHLKTGECYQQLLSVLQRLNQERDQQEVEQRELHEQLESAQKQLSSMETTLAQRASHYQNLHAQLLDRASQSTALEKELKKTKSCLVVLRKQLLEKDSAYSQATTRNCQLELELQDQDNAIKQCKTVLDNKQTEFQQALENIKTMQAEVTREHTDRTDMLQRSLDRTQTEIEMLEQTIRLREREREEAQRAAGLLQVSLDQLTQSSVVKDRQSEETLRQCKERALESAAVGESLQAELRSCQKELVLCRQIIQEANQDSQKQLQAKSNEVAELRRELDSEQRERLEEEKEASRQAALLACSVTELRAEMVKCRSELADVELELLRLRKDGGSKASQLCQLEDELQQTHGLLKKKSEAVIVLEEKLHCSEMECRNSAQRVEALEEQLQALRDDLSSTLQHLQGVRNVLQHTQLTSQQHQADMDKLSAELRECQTELEQRTQEVFSMDAVLKDHQGELEQRAQMLGQLDVLIYEHNVKMETKVLLLQKALEKTETSLLNKHQESY